MTARIAIAILVVLLALTALAFLLANVGGGHGVTKLFGG